MYNDDIAAISTPPGEGGIAIIRLSGSQVIEKVNNIFKPYKAGISLMEKNGYTMSLGWIIDNQGEIIDEVLVAIMRAPHSYTGEDVVEINCHGGTLPARKCLEKVLTLDIRLAEPGEFTRRAFLNGRLDVSQAEAVIEVIRSKTEKGLRLAMKQLSGRNSDEIYSLEDKLIAVNALVEASIDFPDEVGEPDYTEVKESLEEILNRINRLIEAGKRADIYREGITIAIAGKPNVGKSSLLNALLRKEKAIVTDIPGTTRDVIEDYINVRGIPVKLVDTAGIRATEDIVEKIGVERSGEVIRESDLVIFLLDVETGITEEDKAIYQRLGDKKVIVLVNKEDLENKNLSEHELEEIFKGVRVIRGSVKEDIGLDELEKCIEDLILAGEANSDNLEMMFNIRQKNALIRAGNYINEAIQTLNEVPLDCLGVDVWGALEALGEITGKNLKDEILDRIFHDFCIGK